MAGRIKGITVEINGDTKNLSSALSEVDKTAKQTTTELSAINRGLKFDADSPVLLKQKFEVLQDAIKTTSTRLDALKQAQAEVDRQFAAGEIDAGTYRKFQREIEQTEGKLRAFKAQADSVKSKVDVQADTSALDKVKSAIRELPAEAKQAGKEIGQALSTGAAGVTAAGAAMVVGMKDVNTDFARLATNAEIAGVGLDVAENAMRDLYTITGETDSAVETVSNLLASGFQDNNMEQVIEGINGAAIRFSDTLKTEGIADGIQETFATGEAIGMFAELLERSGVNLEDFNAKLAKAKETGSETDLVMQTLADLGLNDVTEKYKAANKELVENNEATYDSTKAVADLATELTPLVTTITKVVTAITEFATENKTLSQIVFAVSAAITVMAGVVMGLAPVFAALKIIAGALGIGIGALAAPIGIAVAAIAALVAGGVLLYKNWDTIKAKSGQLAVFLATKFGEMVVAIRNKMTEIVKSISTNWGKAMDFFEGISLIQIGKDIINGLINGIKNSFGNVRSTMKNLADSIIGWGKEFLRIFSPSRRAEKEIGENTGLGVAKGIENTFDDNKKAMNQLTEVIIAEGKRQKSEVEKLEKAHQATIADILKKSTDQIKEIKLKAKEAEKDLTAAELRKIEKLETDSNAKVQAEKKKLAEAIKKIEADASSQRLAAIKKFADDKKAVEELSLVDEVNLWRKSVDQFKKGSAEHLEAEKNYNQARQRVNDEVVRINQTYSDKMKAINDDLVAQEKSLTAAYEQTLGQRTKSLVSFAGLFDEFSSKVEVSGDQLLANLQSQVGGFKDWQDQITDLSGRGINDELLAELRELGPKALPQLIALNSLTDEQLSQYSALYQEKSALARQQAEQELKGMKDDTARQIDELRSVANQKLLALKDEWTAQIRSVTEATKTEFKTLNQIGIEAGQNLLDGLKSMEGSLVSTATAIAQAVNKALGDTLVRGVSMPGINSTTASLGNAVANAYGSMANSARKVASSPGSIINNYQNNSAGQEFNGTIIVQSILDGKLVAESTYDPIIKRFAREMTVADNAF